MEKIDITIIGGGAVGLAIAARLARPGRSLVLLEKNDALGQETSSRNSEVIHAGIYYPAESLKARLCVAGNPLIYAYCDAHHVRYRKTGKIIVAVSEDEEAGLEKLRANGVANGVPGLKMLSKEEVRTLEPSVTARAGLWSETTGIFDTHGYMQSLAQEVRAQDGIIACAAAATRLEAASDGFLVTTAQEGFSFFSSVVINAAGLGSEQVAALAGIDTAAAGYTLHFCKGMYFRLHADCGITHLVYPVPSPGIHSLGIHMTPDLTGSIRLGPDAHYVDAVDYTVDPRAATDFAAAARRCISGIPDGVLLPDTAGVRPKLQGPDDGFRDFVITPEAGRGLPRLVDLIGIESPGLTSSSAIAGYVDSLLRDSGLI